MDNPSTGLGAFSGGRTSLRALLLVIGFEGKDEGPEPFPAVFGIKRFNRLEDPLDTSPPSSLLGRLDGCSDDPAAVVTVLRDVSDRDRCRSAKPGRRAPGLCRRCAPRIEMDCATSGRIGIGADADGGTVDGGEFPALRLLGTDDGLLDAMALGGSLVTATRGAGAGGVGARGGRRGCSRDVIMRLSSVKQSGA